MSNLYEDLASLTPEQRELFEVLLQKEGVASSQLPIPKRDTATPPLSPIQERFLFLQQLMPENPGYNLERALQIRGPLDSKSLEKSFDALLRRHEIFRTTYVLENETPVMRIAAANDLRLPIVDLQHLPEAERLEKAQELAQVEARKPFDLSAGPMLRVLLVKLANDDHLLILVLHHITVDGFSEALFARELAALYRAFSQGTPLTVPDLPIQYADYTCWERRRLQGTLVEEQLAYWKEKLAGAPVLLDLPTDHPRPRRPAFSGATVHFSLEESLSQELRDLSRRLGVTWFATLLATYQILLHRCSGQDDIVVATAVTNRNRPELENLVGSFANTVALRADFSRDLTFRDFVTRVSETTLEALSNQDLPFDLLVKELHPKRDPSYNPIFQATFELHQATFLDNLDLPGLTLSYLPVEKGTARFDLDLSMANGKHGFTGALEYDGALFEAATIKRLLGHFERLLQGIVVDPNLRLSELSWITNSERRQLLLDWNDTEFGYSKDALTHTLFEVQAERSGEAIAAVFEGRSLSYRELDCRADRLAGYLTECGVRSGVLVGVCLERSVEMVVGVLGVLKAGGAYVPLDPEYPQERLRYILEDAKAPVLLTQEGFVDRFSEHSGRVVCIDRDWEAIALCASRRLVERARPEDLAYVIYTSGSTGRPKGVEVRHRGVVSFLTSMAREPGLSAEDVLLAVTTLSFDISALELFLPLSIGAQVVIASREVAIDGEALSSALRTSGATVMQATPATWRLLVEAGWRGPEGFKALCGGEALAQELAQELLGRAGSVWNLYGPTEATVWSTCYRIKDPEEPISIGRPIGNTRLYVLDRYRQLLPVGIPGELYIGGEGVARGYLNRPELTAERFVPDPFSEDTSARLYRTGDRVRYRPDGNLEYLGRLDHQVKVRGFRIELGEIESVLEEHPAVGQAAVIVRPERAGDPRLVAYVVPSSNQVLPVTELRRYLRGRLPEYMVPPHLMELEIMPLTPNGKVDRKALPSPFGGEVFSEERHVAPRTETEVRLASVWQEVLGVEQVGLHDNFFELGGHSLLAMRLVARMEKVTGVRVGLRAIVSDTLEQIAAACSPEKSSPARADVRSQRSLGQRLWSKIRASLPGTAG